MPVRASQSQSESVRASARKSQSESVRVSKSQSESVRASKSQSETVRVSQRQSELYCDYFRSQVLHHVNLAHIFNFHFSRSHSNIILTFALIYPEYCFSD